MAILIISECILLCYLQTVAMRRVLEDMNGPRSTWEPMPVSHVPVPNTLALLLVEFSVIVLEHFHDKHSGALSWTVVDALH